MKPIALRLVRPALPPPGVLPELAPFVEAMAELLVADHIRRQLPVRRVRLLPPELRGRG